MSGTYIQFPSTSGGGGSGGLSSISFSIGTFDSQAATSNGASVSSNSIFLQSASASNPGLVSSAAQTFSGAKTFQNTPVFSSLTLGNIVTIGSSNQLSTVPYTASPNGATIVFRDINGNAAAVNFVSTTTTVQSSGTANLALSAGSARQLKIIGSNSMIITLPDASTLYSGQTYEVNNNSTGVMTVNNNGGSLVTSVISGAYVKIFCVDNSTVNGIWDNHALSPANAIWGSSRLNIVGSFSASSLSTGVVVANSDGALLTGSVSAGAAGFGIVTTVGPLDGNTASPNAATIGSNSITLQSASAANPGIVSSANQTFAGVKTFNGQIIAPGGVGLSSTGTLALGADANSQTILIGSTAGTIFYQKIGLAMNAPQAAIHWGASLGNSNTTSGTVGSYSIVLGKMSSSNNLGAGAVIIGGNTAGALTASGVGAIAIGDGGARAEGSFSVALGDGALAQSLAAVAIGNAAQVTSAQTKGVAAGDTALVTGASSVAVGNGVTAAVAGQTVTGSFNIVSTGAAGVIGSTDESFVVGIGTSNTQRANAFSCTRDGSVKYSASSSSAYIQVYTSASTTAYSVTQPLTQGSSTCSNLVNDGFGRLSWLPVRGSTVQVISSGSGTYNTPSGVMAIKVTCVGGGGGGGGVNGSGSSVAYAAGGGGAGATVIKTFTFGTLASTYSYVVSDKGLGAVTSSSNGTAGSATVFGTMQAGGGAGGAGQGTGSAGPVWANTRAAGSLTFVGGDVGLPGGDGDAGQILSNSQSKGGAGGNSFFSQGASGGLPPTIANGSVGQNYGTGGGGAASAVPNTGGTSKSGGNGGPGVIIVEEFYS